MGKMYLMCGLSGVGKTTYCGEFIKNHPDCEYLSIDRFYKSYNEQQAKTGHAYDDPDISFNVWITFFQAIHKVMMSGKDVLIDTNSPTVVKRKQFIDWFPNFDEYNLIFIWGNVNLCRENNLKRDRVIPEYEMKRMVHEFEKPIRFTDTGFIPLEPEWSHITVIKNVNNTFVEII